MRVKVKLFATLAQYVPGLKPGEPFEVDLREQALISDLLNQLNVPIDEAKVIFVNGRPKPSHSVLENGDEVGIFPVIGGG